MVEIRIGDGDVVSLSYEEFEERVAAGRVPDDALVRFEPVTGDAFVPAGTLDLVESLRQDAATRWRARFTRGGAPILTALLVGVQIRIWIYTHVPDAGPEFAYGFLNWLPPAMENGEMWRILGSGLLHTDFLHILLNMVWLGYTGWNIERALGRANLAAIFFLSVVSGGLMSMLLTPAMPSLGASGGVYGLVSASVVFGLVRQELLPERGRRLFGVALAPYLILMFWGGLQSESTDNWAHFGGLLCGGLLAFLLDPPEFQRRAGQNAAVQAIGYGASALLLVSLGVFGPRLYPLVDQEVARIAALPKPARARVPTLPPDALAENTWQVPAGWKPSANSVGDAAFRSPPQGHRRSFAVVQIEEEGPLSLDALAARWEESVRRVDPDAMVRVEPPRAWQGQPASRVRHLVATVETKHGTQVLDFVGTTRGVYGFYRVIDAEAAWSSRLAPLFARVDRTVVWEEPLALQSARRDHAASPRSVRTRTDLARELARWGELDAAIPMHRALIDERPDDPDRWVALIHALGWAGDADALFAAVDEALAAVPAPRVVVHAANGVREHDPLAADGLLGLAWIRSPGDRELRRALRRAQLPWTFDGAAMPTELALLPDGSAREPAEIVGWQDGPFDLATARRWGAQVRAEREQLGAMLPAALASGDAHALLLRLRDGAIEPAAKAGSGLSRDLLAVRAGEPPRWMPASLRAHLEDPAVLDAVIAEVDAAG